MRVREHVCPGRAHPPREQWRDLGAIGALEGKDKPPRGGVIAQGGAGAVEYRVVTDACAADGVVAGRQLERRTAGRAERSGNETQIRPAGRAHPAVTLDGGTTIQALGRHQKVERDLTRSFQPTVQRDHCLRVPLCCSIVIIVRFNRRLPAGSNPKRGRVRWCDRLKRAFAVLDCWRRVARSTMKARCSRFCDETAGPQGSADGSQARVETLWPAGFDRHGQASVIPSGGAGDRQRDSPRDLRLARQPGRKLAPAVPETGMDDGQIQGRQNLTEICRRPRLDPQPLQPPAPSQPPPYFQTGPSRRPGRVASTRSLRAFDCSSYRSNPVSLMV